MKDYQHEINELKAKITELETKIGKGKDLKTWEPSGKGYFLNGNFQIDADDFPHDSYILAGTTRNTKEQAEKLAKELRSIARMLAYRDEFAPGYEGNFGASLQANICANRQNEYFTSMHSNPTIGAIYFPDEVAEDLVKKLNSGEVVF